MLKKRAFLPACAAALLALALLAAGIVSYNADSAYNQRIFEVLDAYAYANPMPEEEIAALDALLARHRPNPISYVRIAHKDDPSNTVYSYRAYPIAVSETSVVSSTRPWQLEYGIRYSSAAIRKKFWTPALLFFLLSVVLWIRVFRAGKRGDAGKAGSVLMDDKETVRQV